MKKFTTGIMVIMFAMLAGCSDGISSKQPVDSSSPIVKVNQSVITQKMFDKAFDNMYNSSILAVKNINIKDPKNKPLYLVFKGKIINGLIIKSLISQEAEKQKIIVTDDQVKKAVDEMSKKVGGESKLDATLTLNNVSKDEFLDNIRFNLVTNKLIDNLTLKKAISDNESLDFYNKNKTTKFVTPDLVRAQHILIAASEKDIRTKLKAENPKIADTELDKKVQTELDKAKAKAENVLALVKAAPANFEKLARDYSDDTASAQKGGDLGYFRKDAMVPEFANAAYALAPGQISDIIKTQYGYHIIKVADRKKAGITPYIEVKDDIKKYMLDQYKMTMLKSLLDKDKNSAKIIYLNKDYNLNTIQNELKSSISNKEDLKIMGQALN